MISVHIFHIYHLIWMQFGVHNDFEHLRSRKSHTFLMGVNEITFTCVL